MNQTGLSSEQRAARAAEVSDLIEQLGRDLVIPAGHRFDFDRKYETTFYLGGPGHRISAFVRRDPYDAKDAEQIYAEVWVHLDSPRADLWFQQGPHLITAAGWPVNVLAKADRYAPATTYIELFGSIRERLSRALVMTTEMSQRALGF